MDSKQQFKFKGVIIKCTYDTPDYKIYAIDVSKKDYPDIKQNKYGNVSILGELSDLTLGVEYEITAEEQINKYGTSYKVINIKRDMPTTTEGTFLFLSEILTMNQAQTLVENYPNIIQKVKDNDLGDIDFSKLKGIGAKTFEVIKNKIILNFALMDLVIEFKNVLSMSIIKKIYDEYSSIDKLKEKLRSEPYTALTRISRIGFKTADSITLQLQKENIIDFGYDIKTSPDRCLSCILYLLEENENEGHTNMNLADLRQQCLKMVPACANHFVDVIKDDNIYYNKDDMTVALKKTYETEKYIADTILSNVYNMMTHGKQYAKTDFTVELNGKDSSANVVSRSVAKDESYQVFYSNIKGNNKCAGHTECDAIIMDDARVSAIPEITANHIDASLIHEAAIGKIAGEQLMKLMTLGLTEQEAEEQIVNGFLK